MYTIEKDDYRVPVETWIPPGEIEDGTMIQIDNAARHPDVGAHIAVMPDVHQGYGVTIGSVFPTVDVVVPNAVGVDIGCFTGDTRVQLLDGTSRALKEMSDAGGVFHVYASTPDGKVVAATATAMLTRRSASLVEVELDSGEKIRCTPDHQFMLRSGSYREARRLAPGTALMPLYSDRDKEGYARIQQNYSGRWHRAHWVVARSGLLGETPRFEGQRTIIHHRDFDEANNLPDNLEFMGNRNHSRHHRRLVDRNTHFHSPLFETKRLAALAAKAATEDGHAYFAERGTQNILAYMAKRPDHFAAAVAGNGKRGKPYLPAYNTSEQGRAKSREITNRLFVCPDCGIQVRSPIGLHNLRRSAHSAGYNHRVVAVKELAEVEDVYCLNVPAYHNFALESGVFVHNCGMCAIDTGVAYDRERMDKAFWRHWSGQVSRNVPTGFNVHRNRQSLDSLDRPLRAEALQPLVGSKGTVQLGTLGGGNHFLEAQVDKRGMIWFMVHSGSRHTGLRIAGHYNQLAKEITARRGRSTADDLPILPLDDQAGQDYVADAAWATDFALESRKRMLAQMLVAFERELPPGGPAGEMINIHHNFARTETHDGQQVVVHRKGATSAAAGELGIIPGSMGTSSYIVRGKGNPESLASCSHGAGRRMGRNAARKAISEHEFQESVAATFSKASMKYIDEAPGAYKDIDIVIGRQDDLVDIVHRLTPIITLKGDSKARED